MIKITSRYYMWMLNLKIGGKNVKFTSINIIVNLKIAP